MEQYIDRYHEDYIPGTYSIYTAAVLRELDRERRRNRQSTSSSVYSSKISSLEGLPYQNGPGADYNYKYNRHTPLELIPELKTRYGVILLPQPTNSPNDPLNWSTRRKALHFILLMLVTGFTAAITNDASTPQESINDITGISYDDLNDAAGVLFASIGLGTWFLAPLVPLLGRKITYLICLVFALIGSCWYGAMQYTGDSYGSQVFIGMSEACSEALVQLCLSSIFFRHQLGAVLTTYVYAFCLGTYLGPLVANYICSGDTPFRWVGWEGAILSGVVLLLFIFFFEEDFFDYSRFKDHYENAALLFSLNQQGIMSHDNEDVLGYYDKAYSLWDRLKPVTLPPNRTWHTFSEFCRNYVKLLLFNLKCLWFPPVIFAGLIWGIQDAILTFYLTTEDTDLYYSPFNYSSERVALMNVPCIIGATIGCLYSGSATDYFILWLARKKGGTVESEYRLYFAFLSGIIGSVGLLMFGIGVSEALDWRVYYVGLGFIAYTFASSMNISLLYVVDSYNELILETLVALALINNVIGCIFTFACSPWLAASGDRNTYIALAVVQFVLVFSAIPYIIWGKKWRKMTRKTYLDMVDARSDTVTVYSSSARSPGATPPSARS